MTDTKQYADREGEFSPWQPTEARCWHAGCRQPVEERKWESKDGGFEDYQYRCANGHTWWIDGIDS